MTTIIEARAYAIDLIERVTEGHSLADEFIQPIFLQFSSQEQSWIKALCLGVCRHYYALHGLLETRLKKAFKNKDKKLTVVLIVAIYELLEMHTPHYACVSQYVAIAGKNAAWAKGLVNAILRGIIRDHEKQPISLLQFKRFPDWWINQVERDWPNESQRIFQEDQHAPPLVLRINRSKISWQEYAALLIQENLEAHGFTTSISELNATAMEVTPAVGVQQLPKFSEGYVSIQDVSAQYAAFALNIKNSMRVLDACAAPGGKTAHLLERHPDISLTALDISPARLHKISENLIRLQLSASINLIANNALNTDEWWDGNFYDRILLDAPCSASGVVRRHPDIKLLRKEKDIKQCSALQLQLLTALWPTLAKEGELLYATCSIFKEENECVIEKFLALSPNAVLLPLPEIGLVCRYGTQRLPGIHVGDGFYYARLKKT